VTALPVAPMLLATGGVLIVTPPGYRLQLVLGTTWRTTVADVVLLSLPPLAAALHGLCSEGVVGRQREVE